MPFKQIGLCDELVEGILATGYTAPTEIQAEAIPIVIAGKDMIGCAQTGTGKTAAFVLPILNRISTTEGKTKKRNPRALILVPTRELAEQIDKAVKGYGRFIKMYCGAVYGGASIDRQINMLRKGLDVLVATPGRLIDHMERGNVNLSAVEVLVLDEADRMLDMGFVTDIKRIILDIPQDRQTLLFSATMSKGVESLTKDIQRMPKMIQIGKQHNPIETITQYIYPVPQEQKMDLLIEMINRSQMYSVLVFSRTKRGADKICKVLLQSGIKAESLHSDRTQRQRQRALDGFKSGKFQVMVATDVAARGINVEGISHVFNFDVPAYAEDYVHRIGRTGRAAATGDAITFVAPDEIAYIRKIEKFIDRKFTAEYLDGFEYSARVSLDVGPAETGGRKKIVTPQHRRPDAKAGGQRRTAKPKFGGSGKDAKGRPAKPRSKKTDSKKRSTKPKPKNQSAGPAGSKKTRKPPNKRSGGSKPVGESFKKTRKKNRRR